MQEFVNFASRGSELQKAYKAVVQGSKEVEWALFTYEPGTNILCVEATGSESDKTESNIF
jgi:hypothetical protein